jgi:hypothetical protein
MIHYLPASRGVKVWFFTSTAPIWWSNFQDYFFNEYEKVDHSTFEQGSFARSLEKQYRFRWDTKRMLDAKNKKMAEIATLKFETKSAYTFFVLRWSTPN